jgi:hypothetical protein
MRALRVQCREARESAVDSTRPHRKEGSYDEVIDSTAPPRWPWHHRCIGWCPGCNADQAIRVPRTVHGIMRKIFQQDRSKESRIGHGSSPGAIHEMRKNWIGRERSRQEPGGCTGSVRGKSPDRNSRLNVVGHGQCRTPSPGLATSLVNLAHLMSEPREPALRRQSRQRIAAIVRFPPPQWPLFGKPTACFGSRRDSRTPSRIRWNRGPVACREPVQRGAKRCNW